jgi:hypothetical protein
MAYYSSLPYIPNYLCSILRVGSALIKANISSSIVGGYTGSIVKGVLKALGALGTSKSLLIKLGKEER